MLTRPRHSDRHGRHKGSSFARCAVLAFVLAAGCMAGTASATQFNVTSGNLADLLGPTADQGLGGTLEFDGSTLTLDLTGLAVGTTVTASALSMQASASFSGVFDVASGQQSQIDSNAYFTTGSCSEEGGGLSCNFTFAGGPAPSQIWSISQLKATAPAVPEPSAAMLFVLGAVVFRGALYRRN